MTDRNDWGAIVSISKHYFHLMPSKADRDDLVATVAEGWATGLARLDTSKTHEEQTAFLFNYAKGYVCNLVRERTRRSERGEILLSEKAQEVGSVGNATENYEGHVARLFMGIQLDRVLRAVEDLPERERRLIRARYLEGKTLDEMGKEMGGISRERVRQIEKKALDSLRHYFNPRRGS